MEKLIKQYFEYRNGSLYWLQEPRSHKAKAGDKVTGSTDPRGYQYTRFKGRCLMLGAIVFFLHYDCFPAMIHYKDGDKSNINIDNLEPSSHKLIQWSGGKRKGEYASKYKGVSWRSDRNRWRANIKCNGKNHYIGLYDNEDEAARAYNKAALELFGSYAYLNEVDE